MSGVRHGLQVLTDPEAVARAATERIVAAAGAAIARAGEFRLGLSGGRTPERLFRMLAGPAMAGRVEWARVHFLFADERDAPPSEPESNYWIARKLLIEPVGAAPDHVHRMKADARDLEAAARDYERWLATPLDLLLLGVGADGHTASIFPGSPLACERTRRVAAVRDSPKPPPRRLTITPRVIEEALEVVVVVTGSEKARAVARAFDRDSDPVAVPARLLRDASWLVDRAAGAAEAAARARDAGR